jgi:hypothetical protein
MSKSKSKYNFSILRIIALLYFSLIILFQLKNINRDLSGWMIGKEIRTADIIRNLKISNNPLYPEVRSNGPHNKYTFFEFPLYHTCVVLLTKALNIELIPASRIFSLFCWLGSFCGLYFILKNRFSERAVIASMIFISTSYLSLSQSSFIQIDIFMTFLYIMGFQIYELYDKKNTLSSWFLVCIITLLCVFAKFSSIFLFIFPLSKLLLKNNFKKTIIYFLLLFTIVATPILLWINHITINQSSMPEQQAISFFVQKNISNWIPNEYYNIYKGIYQMLTICYLGNSAFFKHFNAVIFLFAFSLFFISKKDKMINNFIISFVFYVCFFNSACATHYYYWLPSILIFSYLVGLLINKINNKLIYYMILSVFIINGYLNLQNLNTQIHNFRITAKMRKNAEILLNNIPENSCIVSSSEPPDALLYCSGLYGWDIDTCYFRQNTYEKVNNHKVLPGNYYIRQLNDHIAKGAEYYVLTHFSLNEIQNFKQYLNSNYEKVLYDPGSIVIYKLNNKNN